jgi:integrase
MSAPLLNAAGRRRAHVTLPGYLAGRPPRNKGLRYPPDPPTGEEIVAVMRAAGDRVHGARMRAFIVLLWRAGLRINEALTVTEHDLDPRLGAIPGPLRQGRPPPRSRHGPVGLGPPPALARAPRDDAGRPASVRDRRPHPREALGERLSPRPTAARRRQGRRAAAVRAAPTPPRPHRRTRPREVPRSTSSSANRGIPT